MSGNGWTTPKLICKKRRKSSIQKYHESNSITKHIRRPQGEGSDKENVQKFNPFSTVKEERPKSNGIGLSQETKVDSAPQV